MRLIVDINDLPNGNVDIKAYIEKGGGSDMEMAWASHLGQALTECISEASKHGHVELLTKTPQPEIDAYLKTANQIN